MNSGSDFEIISPPVFEEDAVFEDNSAAFFDADADGDLDLYVGSGISSNNQSDTNKDRLYLYDNGKYVGSNMVIPDNSLVTSTVQPYDYDLDGDTDLFIGNLSDPKSFGKRVNSYLLRNNGNGTFEKDKAFQLESMVTNALWKDINGDGIKDLLVASEWDLPHVFLNNKGTLSEVALPDDLKGLWQSIDARDVDGDGDLDLLLGNLGLNTKFNLYFDGPLQLYYSDFDKNGVFETMIAYNRDGNYYPLNSKDELAAQMNVINKIYTSHEAYAGKTMVEVMKSGTLKEATKYEANTLSSGYVPNEDGRFSTFIPFARDLQLGPINDFQNVRVSNEDLLLVSGNSYKFNTYHGSYSSLKGSFWNTDTQEIYNGSELGLDPLNEQVKKVAVIKMEDYHLLIIISNNDATKCYQFKN